MKILQQNHPEDDALSSYKFLYKINLFSAILTVLFGLILIFAPQLSVTFLLYAFAVYVLISGIFHLISIFRYTRNTKEKIYLLIKDIISILTGVLILVMPGITLIVLIYSRPLGYLHRHYRNNLNNCI